MSEFVKKLSGKVITGMKMTPAQAAEIFMGPAEKDGTFKAAVAAKPLYTVMGYATGIKMGESDFGPWVGFKGQFVGTNLTTGEEYKSVMAFLPEIVTMALSEELGACNDAGRPVDKDGKVIGKRVEFAVEIGIKKDKDSQQGFVYTARPLIDVAETDDLKALQERAKMKALPGPVAKEEVKGKK